MVRRSCPVYQNGQALPLSVIFFVLLFALVFFSFNSGQLVQEKMRLTNTADAVALSAGNFEARLLNYDAYTNRAMIANEIAIGQVVGLASWATYASHAAETIGNYMRYIPYLQVIGEMLNQAAKHARSAIEPLAAAVSMHDSALNALSQSQLVAHGSSLTNRQQVIHAVAKANDPDVIVDLLPLEDSFIGFTKRYTSREDRQRMGVVVRQSRDDFLISRNWTLEMIVPAVCDIGFRMKKRGSTELINDVDGWKSMDTLSFHRYWIRWRNGVPRCRQSETPVGYGTGMSENQLPDQRYSYRNSRRENPRASRMADTVGIARGFAPDSITGGEIPAYFDLSEQTLRQGDPRARLTIRVSKRQQDLKYSRGNSAVNPAGQLELYEGKTFSREIAAVSSVEVYFERPDGANNIANGRNKRELGSLFNPYWQAHLVTPSPASIAMARSKQGATE